jgi:hypothetical protein
MLNRRRVGSGLLAVLGGATLALSISVGRAASAGPPPFSNSNYANRYECNLTSDDNFFTGIALLFPNGSGTYNSGILWVADNQFSGFDPGLPPPQNFCTYLLDVAGSSYSIGSNGLGVEVLSWTAIATDNAACPPAGPGSTFTMSDANALRTADTRSAGAVVFTQTTSNNFADQDDPGYGPCLK